MLLLQIFAKVEIYINWLKSVKNLLKNKHSLLYKQLSMASIIYTPTILYIVI